MSSELALGLAGEAAANLCAERASLGVVLLQEAGAPPRSSQAPSWCCNGQDGW